MIRAAAAVLALLPGLAVTGSGITEPVCRLGPGELIAHDCEGEITVDILLLPEDRARFAVASETRRVLVTGAYTSAETREDGRPLPVGLFVRGGEVVSRRFAPMDGVLIVRDGAATLHHRARVHFGGRRYDLNDPELRDAFLAAVARAGASVLQSHLLVVDGRVDVRPDPDAPRFRRRLLFIDGQGALGLWQTDGSVTLYDAAQEIRAAQDAVMALNLDMGSFDLCLETGPGEAIPEAQPCGLLAWDDHEKLSNLIVLALP